MRQDHAERLPLHLDLPLKHAYMVGDVDGRREALLQEDVAVLAQEEHLHGSTVVCSVIRHVLYHTVRYTVLQTNGEDMT